MKARILLMMIAVSSFLGCGGFEYALPYVSGPFKAESGCITFRSNVPIDQEALDFDVRRARDSLDARGILKAEDFCEEFRRVPFAISGSSDPIDGHLDGRFDTLRGIILVHHMRSLEHEMLHEIQFTRDWVLCSAAHCGWKENGYFAASTDYQKEARDVSLRR